MFEPGFDQAAGLRSHAQRLRPGPALMPLASPAQPSRAFEWLCQLAVDLGDAGHAVAVIDATATERAGLPDGLLGALNDPSVANLGPAHARGDWLVMPGRRGLHVLQTTARAGGANAALSRLFAPFAADVLVLLYAPAQDLVTLLVDVPASVLVPVIDQPQASIDAYGALKWLHAAGLSPVLAPLEVPPQVLANVADCALRHLGLKTPVWPRSEWARRLPESALVHTGLPRLPDPSTVHGARAGIDSMARQSLAAHPLWS